MRDDFTEESKRTIAQRVGYLCSRPGCRALTTGPQVDSERALNLGEAAHITAASPGGPRYDSTLTSEQRRHPDNAIWLCRNCAKLADNDASRFTVTDLREWRSRAEAYALFQIGRTAATPGDASGLSREEWDLLVEGSTGDESRPAGIILKIEIGQEPGWVRAGQTNFGDNVPGPVAAYVDAIEGLVAKRLLRRTGVTSWELTGRGFKLAESLTAPHGGPSGTSSLHVSSPSISAPTGHTPPNQAPLRIESFVVRGTGQEASRLFDLEATLYVFKLEYSGPDNFIVRLLDASGNSIETLANVIGEFDGSRAVRVPIRGKYLLNVAHASGPWSATIGPPEDS